MSRANRQLKILEIISKFDIDTQEEIAKRLNDDGFNVTQATISRDIKDMGLIKTLSIDGRKYKYVAPNKKETTRSDKYLNIFRNTVLSIAAAGNLIVIKTESGSANAAAELIDNLKYDEVVGTLAGDNSIFVAVDSVENATIVKERLDSLLDNKKIF